MPRPWLLLLLACPLAVLAAEPIHGGPVIDMHLHAFRMGEVPPGVPACPGDSPGVLIPTIDPREAFDPSKLFACNGTPIFAAASDADLRDKSIAALRRHDVRRAVTEGPVELVADWRKTAPGVILPGVAFGARKDKTIAELRRLHAAGQLAVLGEVYIQYRGHRADDPRYEPYFALAAELDIRWRSTWAKARRRQLAFPATRSTAPAWARRSCWRTCCAAIQGCAST